MELQDKDELAHILVEKVKQLESRTACHFDKLANENIFLIFRYCTGEVLGQISRVCKIWCKISNDEVLWKDITFNIPFFNETYFREKFQFLLERCQWKLIFANHWIDWKKRQKIMETFASHRRAICFHCKIPLAQCSYPDAAIKIKTSVGYIWLCCEEDCVKFLETNHNNICHVIQDSGPLFIPGRRPPAWERFAGIYLNWNNQKAMTPKAIFDYFAPFEPRHVQILQNVAIVLFSQSEHAANALFCLSKECKCPFQTRRAAKLSELKHTFPHLQIDFTIWNSDVEVEQLRENELKKIPQVLKCVKMTMRHQIDTNVLLKTFSEWNPQNIVLAYEQRRFLGFGLLVFKKPEEAAKLLQHYNNGYCHVRFEGREPRVYLCEPEDKDLWILK